MFREENLIKIIKQSLQSRVVAVAFMQEDLGQIQAENFEGSIQRGKCVKKLQALGGFMPKKGERGSWPISEDRMDNS